MSQSTTYTCDRCGHETSTNFGWTTISKNYTKKDYCPSCVNKLVESGMAAEAKEKVQSCA